MDIFIIKTPLLDSNMYVIEENKHLIVIDPYWDNRVASLFKNLSSRIDFVYLTHEHYDHISGMQVFQRQYGSRVFCSDECAVGISDTRKNHTRYFEAFCALQNKESQRDKSLFVQPTQYHADDVFNGQFEMEWQGHKLLFFKTPGHSEGSSCLLVEYKFLFCGDSLARDTEVITRFPGGDAQVFHCITLPLFLKLPGSICVLPGHYDSFRLEQSVQFKQMEKEKDKFHVDFKP